MAVAYLHTALSRPVVLRDFRLSTIILRKDYVPKITDFSLLISIPDGYVTEKLNVFCFGVSVKKMK
ncbi:conserved hypothetical protein [Ricinus communis]|uniref:Protein kinase domain-containing protein n=1 Tax=Ricinus communis TaxID=3988 RepID=B9RF79_RICCO|nr:conserved hypothetical protein [Ricinus communis]